MPGKRTDRVGALLQEALSETILRGVKDPRVGMVTVTGVDLSPDLKHARVFVSVVGDAEARTRSLAGLASARAYLQAQAGKRLGLRYTPELRFEIDPSFDAADRVERLLREIHEKDAHPAPDAAAGDRDDPDEPGPSRA
jgi:ribosome-binding factor A